MKEHGNPLSVALRYVFGPIVKQSAKWPPILAYGVPSIIAVLLIVLGRSTLPDNLFWLVVIVVLAPLVAYIFTDWDKRRQVTRSKMAQFGAKLTITGNVLSGEGSPVKDAVVFVEGVDRRKETDENGWFQIEVDQQESWTVRAYYRDMNAKATVVRDDIRRPVNLTLKIEEKPKREQVLLALEKLKELTSAQVRTIEEVVAPIAGQGNFLSTYDKFQGLVDNRQFPEGYGQVRGFLINDVLYREEFREGRLHDLLRDVIGELTSFQIAAFMKKTEWGDSYEMSKAFTKAKELWSLLSSGRSQQDNEIITLQGEVRGLFGNSYGWLATDDSERTTFNTLPLGTPDDVVRLVRMWCQAWLRNVRQTLVRHKIDQAIGTLRGV